MKEKQKELLMDGALSSWPEASVIIGTVAGHYISGLPVWAIGVIALVALAGKIYFKSLKK